MNSRCIRQEVGLDVLALLDLESYRRITFVIVRAILMPLVSLAQKHNR